MKQRKVKFVVYGLPENGHRPTQPMPNVCNALNIPKGQTEITTTQDLNG